METRELPLPRVYEYFCRDCGSITITIQRIPGVTPLFMRCPQVREIAGRRVPCGGVTRSRFEGTIRPGVVVRVWRKPTPEDYDRASPGLQMEYDLDDRLVLGGVSAEL